jgi:hypothetical protein
MRLIETIGAGFTSVLNSKKKKDPEEEVTLEEASRPDG